MHFLIYKVVGQFPTGISNHPTCGTPLPPNFGAFRLVEFDFSSTHLVYLWIKNSNLILLDFLIQFQPVSRYQFSVGKSFLEKWRILVDKCQKQVDKYKSILLYSLRQTMKRPKGIFFIKTKGPFFKHPHQWQILKNALLSHPSENYTVKIYAWS